MLAHARGLRGRNDPDHRHRLHACGSSDPPANEFPRDGHRHGFRGTPRGARVGSHIRGRVGGHRRKRRRRMVAPGIGVPAARRRQGASGLLAAQTTKHYRVRSFMPRSTAWSPPPPRGQCSQGPDVRMPGRARVAHCRVGWARVRALVACWAVYWGAGRWPCPGTRRRSCVDAVRNAQRDSCTPRVVGASPQDWAAHVAVLRHLAARWADPPPASSARAASRRPTIGAAPPFASPPCIHHRASHKTPPVPWPSATRRSGRFLGVRCGGPTPPPHHTRQAQNASPATALPPHGRLTPVGQRRPQCTHPPWER